MFDRFRSAGLVARTGGRFAGYFGRLIWRISLTSYIIGGLSALMFFAGCAGLAFAIRRLRK